MASIANDPEPSSTCKEESKTGEIDNNVISDNNNNNTMMSRKEKRKMLKKMKRKQRRIEQAMKLREEEEARFNDPEEQMKLLRLEQEEAERMENDRREFEERERRFLEELELKKKKRDEEEEERLRKLREESAKSGNNENPNEDDDWEYIEEGPAEIIWKGNEIIVKKKQVKVHKKSSDPQIMTQESDRPTSNPLAPQSEAFEDYKSAQDVLDSVKHEVPNFGTEQDKAHCPFHLKTGVCRFGARCSRVHFYPDKSYTLLMKSMYNGPGLACEQDEGLEYTDEEVQHSFEDFYEDVHTEFLKFGEIINFKVCKNSSSHLRGNVYVHYKSLESALLAYKSINGRYFAGKQISCEFVNVTRWKVAICGEYMRSRLKTCSRGTACNFIHCFRNPGGDYEWADWDKPAPRYWLKKMAALFGYSADRVAEEVSPRKSRSRGLDSGHGKSYSDEDDCWKGERYRRHKVDSRDRIASFEEELHEREMNSQRHRSKHRTSDTVDMSDGSSDEQKSYAHGNRSRKREMDSELIRQSKIRKRETKFDEAESVKNREHDRYLEHSSRSSRKRARLGELDHHMKDKIDTYDQREHSHSDRRHDKHHEHKSKHSVHRTEEADSSDVDHHEDRHERDRVRHRHHSRSKRRSRHMKYQEANSSDSASDSKIDRDGSRCQKNGRRNARSKNESDDDDVGISRGGHERDDRYHRHRRRSSRPHNEDSGLSNVNADGESKSDLEQSLRVAALKRLEDMKKSKDCQPLHNSRYVESERSSHDSHSVVVQEQEVSKDLKEPSDSRKTETTVRRRI